jgi:hypothetical protein
MAISPSDVTRFIDTQLKPFIETIDSQLVSFENIAKQVPAKGTSLEISVTLKNFVDDDLAKLIVSTYRRAGWSDIYYNTTRDEGAKDKPEAYVNTTFRFKLY